MKRCQPDGRSDVRTFLFPWSWVSPLLSRTDYLPAERKESCVTPGFGPSPTSAPCLCLCSSFLSPAARLGDKCHPNATEGCAETRLRESPSALAPSFHWQGEPAGKEEREPRARSSQCWASEGAGQKMPSQLTLSVTQRPSGCSQPHWRAVRWAGGEDRGGVLQS